MQETDCRAPVGALEHLKQAERDLEAAQATERAAKEALRAAERDTAKAEAEVKEAIREVENPRQFRVEVLYDGVKKPFEVRVEEAVKTLLDQVLRAFGPLPNPHTLALYKDGKELPDNGTIEQAGIRPCDLLLLRPSAVKGGWNSMYTLPRTILEETFEQFRACGCGRRECQSLWLSSWGVPGVLARVVHPEHVSHLGGFVVDETWLNEFWLELGRRNMGVRVQVHTHPSEAFHSSSDDAYPIIHRPGFLSLVIPNFAMGPVGFNDAYLTEIQPDGSWKEVPVASRLVVI
jgi:hypothetical protein